MEKEGDYSCGLIQSGYMDGREGGRDIDETVPTRV